MVRFLFDFGRMMYLDEENVGREAALDYVREQISQLDPKKDIIHMTDKKGWVVQFRDGMCVVGDGICADLLSDILGYGGIVVFEHENLQMAIDSLDVLREKQ